MGAAEEIGIERATKPTRNENRLIEAPSPQPPAVKGDGDEESFRFELGKRALHHASHGLCQSNLAPIFEAHDDGTRDFAISKRGANPLKRPAPLLLA
jgi:hypothetical protein